MVGLGNLLGPHFPKGVLEPVQVGVFLNTFFPLSKHSKRRMCKAGCGQEKTKGMADTPGFTVRSEPAVARDNKGSLRLHQERNHTRVTQTSTDLLRSWRGNCDVQILVYNCDPKWPDVSEIARVTDYVVAYSCKGNCTFKEEREHTSGIIMG